MLVVSSIAASARFQDFTVIDVFTRDRVGILFAIANALYHLDVSIHLAKITTNVDRVLDVFYVTDRVGMKIEDEESLERIRVTLLDVLRPLLDPEPAEARTAAAEPLAMGSDG